MLEDQGMMVQSCKTLCCEARVQEPGEHEVRRAEEIRVAGQWHPGSA